MKTLNIIITALAACTMVLSCSDFLVEKPTTQLSEGTVYSTEGAIEAQIAGCYSILYNSQLFTQHFHEFINTGSGLIHWKGVRTDMDHLDNLNLTKYSNSSYNLGYFNAFYSGISKCNILIENLPASPVAEDFKLEIEAEAKFLRAFYYYCLVRAYGDVPLYIESPQNIEETNKPRTVYYKVYAQIISDLNFAEEHMRTPERVAALTPYEVRVNKWAATAYKASVYMTIGSLLSSYEADPNDHFFNVDLDAERIAAGKDPRTPDFTACNIRSAEDAWKLCYEAAEKVITDGPYRLVENYKHLFRWSEPGDWSLPERIFVLQVTNGSPSSGILASRTLPQYPEGTSCEKTKNNNAGRWRPSRFLFQRFAEDNGGKKGTSGYAKKIYCSCPDPRFDASFFHTSYYNLNTKKAAALYPTNSRIVYDSDDYNAPYYKKYLDPTYNVTKGYADFYLMRLAEMYLISAEAAASLSKGANDEYWSKALSRIEDLHKRARNSVDPGTEPAAYPSWAKRTFKDSEALINAIMWERFYELGGEGHEWYDTHRRGAKWLRDQIAVPENKFLQDEAQGGKEGVTGYWMRLYDNGHLYPTEISDLRKSLLMAFPEYEITCNTALTDKDQNDFYWQ